MSEKKSKMIQVQQVEAFLKLDNAIIERNEISSIDTSKLEDILLVTVITKTGHTYIATNINAIELIMQTRPGLLEGKRLKWTKNMWNMHNLFAHPLMQIFAWFKAYNIAMWIHDVTVPTPKGKKEITLKKEIKEPIEPKWND